MVDCNPVCTVPSCASAPSVGFGSHRGYGYGNFGHGNLGFAGYGLGYGSALAESTSNLGILRGAHVSCVNQLPPAEAVIQPPSFNITVPGPVMSASCEPLQVGGNTPCAVGGTGFVGGFGHGGFGHGGFGHGLGHGGYGYSLNRGYLGARSNYVRRGSICN